MKPFNLEKFLAGERAITENGRKVIDFHVFKNGSLYIMFENRACHFYNKEGSPNNWLGEGYDLFMEEKEVDLWINVYCYDGRYEFYAHEKENFAKENISICNTISFKGTYKITIKE